MPSRTLVGILITLAGVITLIAGVAYLTDAPVEATITEKGSNDEGRYVVATTHIGGLEIIRYLPAHEWAIIQPGNHLVYHIQSGTLKIYTTEGGMLIWSG